MNKLMYIGTWATNDPTKATLPFAGALGAKAADLDACIVLIHEAVVLMRDTVADHIRAVGFPPLKELMKSVIEEGIPIYV